MNNSGDGVNTGFGDQMYLKRALSVIHQSAAQQRQARLQQQAPRPLFLYFASQVCHGPEEAPAKFSNPFVNANVTGLEGSEMCEST